jgi:hypothetical protein
VVWRTRNVGYHWFDASTSYADLLRMTDTLGARYVVLRPKAMHGWRFDRESKGRLYKDFKRMTAHPDGVVVLRRRPTPPTPADPTDPAEPAEDAAVLEPGAEDGDAPIDDEEDAATPSSSAEDG